MITPVVVLIQQEAMMRRRTQEQWRSLVEQFEREEGWTHAEFAEAHGVGVAGFRSWLYRLRQEQRDWEPEFAEVVVSPTSSTASEGWELVLPGGILIRTESAPAPHWLAALCREFQAID